MKIKSVFKGLTLLILVITFAAIGILTSAAADLSCLEYDFIGDSCIITDCDLSASGELSVPEYIDGKEVVAIGENAFYDCKNLTAIELPSTLRTIGNKAFSLCTGLADISIPDGVENFGNSVFSKCYGLKTVSLSQSLSSLPEETFYKCNALTAVEFPEGITFIGAKAFENCESLKKLVLPEAVAEISSGCFSGCKTLESIYLPSTLIQISQGAFEKCTGLNSVYYQGSERAFTNITVLSGNEVLTSDKLIFNHNHKSASEKNTVTATCTETGYTVYNCPCGLVTVDDFMVAQGHMLTEFITIYEADCINTGLAFLKCANCSFYEEIVLSLRQHTPEVDEAVEPDCINTGLTEGSHCDVCDKILVAQNTVPVSEHNFTKKISDNQHLASSPTYAVPAKYYYSCSVCDAVSRNMTYTGNTLELGKTTKFISNSTSNSISLGWNKVKDATGYIIFYKNSAGKWKAYKSVKSNTLKISNLPSGRLYEFAVQAYVIEKGKAIYSPGYATLKEATKPTAPAKISAKQNEVAIQLNWSASSGATYYELHYYNTAKKKWVLFKDGVKGCKYTVTNVKNAVLYQFAVRPCIDTGVKKVIGSSYITITTCTKPKAPTLKSTPLKSAVRLNWDKVSGADGYVLYGSSKPNSGYTMLTATTDLTYTISELTSGKTYYFVAYSYKKTPSGTVYSYAGAIKPVTTR